MAFRNSAGRHYVRAWALVSLPSTSDLEVILAGTRMSNVLGSLCQQEDHSNLPMPGAGFRGTIWSVIYCPKQ
eukprot:COSAG02_NODE_5700_length_4111_cov_4.206176_2_plen_72_part_00